DIVGRTPDTWIKLVADFNMGGHLQLNGSLTCYGIEQPICEGDNVEWDDVVLHIESVSHSCSFDASTGKKRWRTSLTLTHGMTSDDAARLVAFNSVNMYAGMPGADAGRLDGFDPGLTYEGGDDNADSTADGRTTSSEKQDDLPLGDDSEGQA